MAARAPPLALLRTLLLPLLGLLCCAVALLPRHATAKEPDQLPGVLVRDLRRQHTGLDLSVCPEDSLASAAGGVPGGGFEFPANTWLVITKQRSGSRWLVDTMSERTGGIVPYTDEMNCKSCNCGYAPTKETVRDCVCKLAKSYISRAKSAASEDGLDSYLDTARHVGFKFMTSHTSHTAKPGGFDTLALSVCAANIPVAFMWRRNILRRFVSGASNDHDHSHPAMVLNGTATHNAHPRGEEEASLLRSYKPHIDPHSLVKSIEYELKIRDNFMAAFKKLADKCEVARNVRVFYYEDLKDTAEGSEDKWGELFTTLRIWVKSELSVIHSDMPVLDTVSNPAEVKAALKNTPYAYMLEL